MALTTGTFIGPYEIVGWLGAGGMGEVYRARDARLGRDVAIKLIPESFAADRNRLHRFEQEARAAGQLNHPNIVAVFDIGTHAGAPYIVSELLEGESLGSRLQGGAVAARKAIDYARQIAEGLAAAHDKGIVHRDLKPDNLFITSDGRIKILDFGIAKLTAPSEDAGRATGLPTETADGMVMGTAGYMSPEQVRGETVDARSDLFSFGAILYQMLTGRAAFLRATAAETVAAILKEDPPESLPPAVPPALDRIVSRCLEKTREARFQSARDLAFGLEVLSATGTGARAAAADPAPTGSRWAWLPWAAVVVLAAAIGLREVSRPAATEGNLLEHAAYTRLTDWNGTEVGADISPDGRFVAFMADREGQFDIYVRQVGTGEPRNLTLDIPALSTPGIMRHFGFSGDGQEVWFNSPVEPHNASMDLNGGSRHAFLGVGGLGAAWSPDGARLVYFQNGDGDPLLLADRMGANAVPIDITPADRADWSGATDLAVHNHNPTWSSDGQWIYFVHGRVRELNWTDDMDVWRVRPAGGTPERLTRQHAAVTFLAPLDPRTLLYTARAEDGSGPWLWELDVPDKITRRLSTGLEQYTSVAASRDGRRVVATIANPTASLWRVPILDRPAEEREAQPYPVARARALAPRFGDASLFFLSARGTGDGLSRFRDGKTLEIWKSTDSALSGPAAASRDGRRVAIVVRRAGRQHLEIMSSDGTDAHALAPSIDVQGTVDWSRDAAWIVAGGRDPAGPALFKIPVAGGDPIVLVRGEAVNPAWSPTSDLIVYSGPVVGGHVSLHGVRPDGTPAALPAPIRIRPGGFRFLPNGTGLVYLPDPQSMDFWLFDLATGAKRQLTRLGDRGVLRAFDIADGHIVFDRSQENSDIVLIALPKR